MKKYYIGIIILSVLTIGLTGYVIFQGASSKQDADTYEKANKIATKLNNYISKKREIPTSPKAASIDDVPDSISYTKKSDSEYEFCVTYKHASQGYGESDVTSLLTSSFYGSQSRQSYDDYSSDSSYKPSSLYLSYSYKVGKNCQTIKPYTYSDSYNNPDPYYTPTTKPSKTNAADTERETDIKALQAQIEAYYAQNSKYPTLADLNSSSFRAINMKGLDPAALKDPQGTSATLASKPDKNTYSYEVDSGVGKTCDNKATDCSYYVLTATLSDDTEFTKSALN